MTDTVALALIAAIPPTLAASAALYISIRNGVKADENKALALEAVKKTDTVIEKAVEIHTLTNSNLSKVTSSLEVANTKIEGLQKMMASMSEAKIVADKLAEKSAETAVAKPAA